jgi:hypothetical protein
LTCDRRHFSRKGAKTQRKTLRNAAALCVFAPLREKPSGIKQFLYKALTRRPPIYAAQQSRNQISSLRSSAYLSALCGEITVTAEDRRDTQRTAEKTFSRKKRRSAYLPG